MGHLALWYALAVVLGLVSGHYAGIWGGLGVLILGAAFYMMTPPRFRAVVTERHALLAALVVLALSAALWPVLSFWA
jgi:hypothetical protein